MRASAFVCMCVCACVYVLVSVCACVHGCVCLCACSCVCAYMFVCVCMCVCVRLVRMCLTSLEVRAWLLVEASSRPGARGGGGAEGGGAGDFHLERFHSVSLVLACCHKMQALKPSTRREAWSGGGASCLGWLPLPLLADLSLFFPFSQCHSHCHFQISLQTTQNCI